MSSRFLAGKGVLAGLAALALAGCQRETRDFGGAPAPVSPAPVSTLAPGGGPPAAPSESPGKDFADNAFHISQGKRLFRWFNCSGCHANGGGGIGPALMDDQWRYGAEIEQVYASIAQGRPNGMPAFQDKVPAAQMWELAAYVRSLSGNAPKSASGSRGEEMANIPPQTMMKPLPARSEAGGGVPAP